MPVVDVYYQRKYQQVMEETFGHLRAKPGEKFYGTFIFCHDMGGMDCLIHFEFPDELNDSPWLHEDITDFMGRVIDKANSPRGAIWKFTGWYIVDKKGWRRFKGKTKRVPIARLY